VKARALLLSLLLPALALAAEGATPRKLAVAFNGDNGGEIAPCG